jgi:hypothetical protein
MSRLIDLQCDADHIDTDETSLRIARGRLGGRGWSKLLLMVTLIGVALRGRSIAIGPDRASVCSLKCGRELKGAGWNPVKNA